MDISSSLTGTKEFRIVKRGYDPDEVNAFLDQIALGVGELKRKLAEAEDTATAARQVAASAPAPAPAPAEPARDTQAEEIHRALILAQRAADEEVRKATEQGETLVASARQQAEDLRAEVEAEVARRRDEGRSDLLTEITELERVRDSLSNDVVVLERHVEEQREVVQAAIGELQSLLDHPEAFRIATETGVSTVTPPIDRTPAVSTLKSAAPAAVAPAPADVAPPADAEEELPGKADLSAALAWAESEAAAAEEEAAVEAPAPRSDGAPPAAPGTRPAGPTAEDTVNLTSPPPAPAADPFAGPQGGDDDDRDLGPPTEAVATVGGDADPDEDAFLAELRKAMLDDEPLGPSRGEEPGLPGLDDDVAGRGRPRFGRRR
jgi:DivIVA domain-containing protein